MRRPRALCVTATASLAWAFCVSGLASEQNQPPADKTTYLADVVQLLQRQYPKNRTVNVVCHGHSVPAGYAKTPLVDTFGAYPHLLHKGLKERFPYAVINVIVTAIGGETSDRGAERFQRDVLSHRPDLVIIDYGLNDRRIGLAKARQSWTSMIEKAKAGRVRVILMTPTADVTARLDDPGDPLNQHARQIRALARQHRVACVDSLSAFRDYAAAGGTLSDLMSQSNHPNRKGHELVAQRLLEWFPAAPPVAANSKPGPQTRANQSGKNKKEPQTNADPHR